jgi:hypothetical protein
LSIRGEGIAELKNFPSLEYLGCWGAASDADVKHIAGLSSLRRLKLRTDAMRGEGLAYLAELPRLEWLHLWGKPFVGNPLRYLEGCKGLKSLHIWHDRLGDAHLASVGKLVGLEELYVRKSPTNSHEFTDAGVAHLKNLKNLREITLPGCRISGLGARHLAALPSLESIWEVGYTGSGLNTLASCPNLKRLRVSIKAVDMPVLSAFGRMEELNVVCKNASDEDVVRIGSLTGITHLTLFEAWGISERGWAAIGKLRNLEYLKIYGEVANSGTTNRGLNHLNALTNLEVLELRMSGRQASVADDTGLDLGALTNLKTARLSGLSLREGDLVFLAGLKNLEELKLQNYGQLSGNVLGYVSGLAKLNRLEIIGITCDDEGGPGYLGGLKQLGFLSLSGRVTDRALGELTGPPSLWGLDITTDVPVRPETVARLKQIFPGVKDVSVRQPARTRPQMRAAQPAPRVRRRSR